MQSVVVAHFSLTRSARPRRKNSTTEWGRFRTPKWPYLASTSGARETVRA